MTIPGSTLGDFTNPSAMKYTSTRSRLNLRTGSILIVLFLYTSFTSNASRIVDFGDNLPDLIEQRPDKNFIIKFYAPWCYSCQRLEPTYHKFAEKIYHAHDHLIVGRVDCTKYGKVCESFNVQAYPTVTFMNNNIRINYDGDRSVESMTEFAERLNGPDVGEVDSCNLESILTKHNQFVLSTYKNETEPTHQAFIKLAQALKARFWFYHSMVDCDEIFKKDNLYVFKKHLKHPIQFKPIVDTQKQDLSKQIEDWLENESFPVYAQIHRYNYEKALASGKTLFITVLEKYEPARKFTKDSARFHKDFEGLVKKLVNEYPMFQYTWTADTDLISWIAIGQVAHPNIMILRPDRKFYLLRDSPRGDSSDTETEFVMDGVSIIKLVQEAHGDSLDFRGGNSYMNEIKRFIYKYYILFTQMFHSNPLLSSLLVLLPTAVLSLVIYLTCCHDANYDDDEDEEELLNDDDQDAIPNERQRLINHIKQD